MPIQFDLQGARKAGYTDTEIADTLAGKAGFDTVGARNAGFKDDEIINRLMAPIQSAADKGAQQVAENTGVGETLLVGAGRTLDRIGKGMQQLYYGATGNEKEQAALKSRAESDDAAYKPLQTAHPVATAVGESLPGMAVPVGAASATLLGTAGKLALSAAAPAALEYGSVEDRAKHAAGAGLGAAIGGAVVPKVLSAVGSGVKASLKGLAGNITPEALALAARAKDLGIDVNMAQLGDSKFLKTLASSIEQMPFTGGSKAAAIQRSSYTNAVGKTFGADVEKVTPEVYSFHRTRLGNQFDELAARNNLNVTPELRTKLGGIVEQASATGSDDTIRAVQNILGRVSEQAETHGGEVPAQMSKLLDQAGNPIEKVAASSTPASSTLPGAAYSSLDSELSNIIKSGGEKGLYAKRMQTAIREAMDESISTADKAAWTETRNQYKNLKAVRNIIARDGGDGNIPPSQLMNALNSTEAGKEAMAMGNRGTLGELGQIGKQFVRDSVPNSGTAQRAMAMGLIGGGGYAFGADPMTIAGMMAGGATAGRLLNKVMSSPKAIEALSKQGISLKDLAKLPPSRLNEILGGLQGISSAEQMMRD